MLYLNSSKRYFMKNVRLQRQFMLTYSNLFTDDYESIDIKGLLADIPLAPAIEYVTQLLIILSNRKREDVNFHANYLVNMMFRTPREFSEIITNYINKNNVFDNPNFLLTSKKPILLVLQALLLHCKGSSSELTKDDNGKLFKLMLIMNKVSLKTEQKIFDWNEKDDDDYFFNLVLPSKINSLGIRHKKDYKIQIVKAFYFFNFCLLDEEYNVYLSIFLKYYGFDTYRDYISGILMPYLSLVSSDESTCKMVVSDKSQKVIDFFEQFVINEKVIVQEDYKTLREFPIFRSSNRTYIFLFNNFFVDKIYNGFLFDFAKIVKSRGVNTMTFGKLKTDMGNRFSEHKLFYSVMKNCFGRYGKIRRTGEELKSFLISGEPDYYIRDGNKVFLFEFKDVILTSKVKSSNDAVIISNELSEKLEESKRDRKKNQNKAVKQLFDSAKELLTGKYHEYYVDEFNIDEVQIYPVLVHTDIALECEGVNYYLNGKLNELVLSEEISRGRIKKITAMNLDTLIAFQDLFGTNKINLATCLKNYIYFTSTGGSMNRMYPFDEYLKNFIVSKNFKTSTRSKDFDRIIEKIWSNSNP